MPPSLEEWLPEDHRARFVVEIVEQLDTRDLERVYAGRGSKAYHPKMLLALLFYGYATGTCSSRKLEQATYESVPVRYVAANQHPDHDTICTFRRRFLPELRELFVQILLLASELGLAELGTVSLDGTKVRANASKHKAMSWKRALELEEKLEEEVALLMQKAEEADQSEDLEHVDLPEEIRLREKRLEGIREAKRRLEERAQKRYEAEQAAHEERMAERREEEERTGRKKPGRTLKPPEPGPRPKDQVNFTDPESRIMPTGGGQFEQCYNAQQVVDTRSRLVVATHVTQAPNDKQELVPALEELERLPDQLGQADWLLADAGYFSADNVRAAHDRDLTPLMAEKRREEKLPLKERLAPDPSAEELSAEELSAEELSAEELSWELSAEELSAEELSAEELSAEELSAESFLRRSFLRKTVARKSLGAFCHWNACASSGAEPGRGASSLCGRAFCGSAEVDLCHSEPVIGIIRRRRWASGSFSCAG